MWYGKQLAMEKMVFENESSRVIICYNLRVYLIIKTKIQFARSTEWNRDNNIELILGSIAMNKGKS